MTRTRLLFPCLFAALGACADTDGSDDAADTTAADATTSGSSGAGSVATTAATSDGSASDPSAPSTSAPTGEVTTDDADGTASTGGTLEPGPDFRERGPHAVTVQPGSASLDGCTMDYDVFAPSDDAAAPTVILAHGFQGNRASMAGWADHWASWGLRVVTPDLCHATIIDPGHAQNGADLVGLVAHLDVGAVALAGYSAGGLAAVLAAAALPDTPALLGLDMVDSNGLGAEAVAAVTAPSNDIVSESAMCNSSSNGVPVFGAISGNITVRVVEADHCDFQNPGDMFCGLCAAANMEHEPAAIQAAIYGLSTAALLWRLGTDDTGAQWWTPGGPYYDEMFGAGLLAQL